MNPNSSAYPTPNNGDRGNRANSRSSKNYNNPKFDGNRTFGAGWAANSSIRSSSNRSLSEDRNRSFNHNMGQPRGRFYSDACAEAYKDKMSERRPPRFGDGWKANRTCHDENRRVGNSSLHESSVFNKEAGISNSNRQGRPSDKRNVDYERANKSFHQMNSRARTQSESVAQRTQDFSQYRGGNSQRVRNHSIATHAYDQERYDNREHNRGQRSVSQNSFVDRRQFVNDRHSSRPKQTSSDWNMPRQQDNYGRVQESQRQNYYPSAGSDSYGRSSSTNNIKQYPRDKSNGVNFSRNQHTVLSGQNFLARPASTNSTSRTKSSHNWKTASDSGRDANTAFHQDDFSDTDWANKSILPGPSDRQHRPNNKNRGKNYSRQNGVTSMHARYGHKNANTTVDRVLEYCHNESSLFNQTNQNLSETIAEDVSIVFDGDATIDDDVFDTTGPLDTTGRLDTSVLPTTDIQDALNAMIKKGGVSSKRFNPKPSSRVVDKKKLFYKTKSQLNQSFGGFERDGPSPILEGDEDTESPMVNRAKGVTPLRNVVNINKSLFEQVAVKSQSPDLSDLKHNSVTDKILHKFRGLSKSHEDLSRLHIKEGVERFHELKRSKSCDILADTVSLGITRDTTSIYDRWGISDYVQELPFKKVAPVTPSADWRCYTKMDRMALPIPADPKTLGIAGKYIAHRGFVPKMPYILVFDNYVCFYGAGEGIQMMPSKFEFDLIPYLPVFYGEVVPGLYEFLDKNQHEYSLVYHEVLRMTRVVNKAPKMKYDEEFPQADADCNLYYCFKKTDEEIKNELATSGKLTSA